MEYSWLSILPPIIAIALALLTKEVISSLLIGILSGVLIFARGNLIVAVESMFTVMGDALGGNAFITHSIAPGMRVSVKNQELEMRMMKDVNW